MQRTPLQALHYGQRLHQEWIHKLDLHSSLRYQYDKLTTIWRYEKKQAGGDRVTRKAEDCFKRPSTSRRSLLLGASGLTATQVVAAKRGMPYPLGTPLRLSRSRSA